MSSRTIKFRAWHKTQNKMMAVKILDFDGLSLLKYKDKLIQARPHHFELLEYIGHDDKNGEKIFEGDILRNLKYGFNCYVVWRSHGFYYRRTNWTEKSKRVAHITEDEVEVIGNIWENPNILKGEQNA